LQEVKGHTLWTLPASAAPPKRERPKYPNPTPGTIDDAPPAARPQLEAVKKMLGSVPNLFRMVANSPAALEGYVGLLGALSKGSLPAATHERIALAIAETNGCDYCLSAHAWLGQNVAKLDDAEMAANRRGASLDPRADAAVRFARQVVERRGHVNDAELRAVREAGYDDAQIIEIVQHVALNTWTNYVNSVAQTVVDFPVVSARKAA
jgi:uncharacterized peroxidase-related enzyme